MRLGRPGIFNCLCEGRGCSAACPSSTIAGLGAAYTPPPMAYDVTGPSLDTSGDEPAALSPPRAWSPFGNSLAAAAPCHPARLSEPLATTPALTPALAPASTLLLAATPAPPTT
mmetsp:Transcript_18091/g.39015  ORF Transcript_18091/g.39015 Transcript_18091/m.39015 type:complete len:114 (+) Transcript_18091:237-578(+)